MTLLLGLVLGAAFGAVLQLSGASSHTKIVNALRLKDMTIIKLILMAIGVGMLGVHLLDLLGLANMKVKDLYVLGIVLAGAVFGVGFAVSGYCPGTGCVGMVSGRLDAMVVVAGMLAGSFVFAEAYPLLATFYQATPLGPVTLPELVGIPGWAGTLAVVALAGGGFALAERIERRHVLPSPGCQEAP